MLRPQFKVYAGLQLVAAVTLYFILDALPSDLSLYLCLGMSALSGAILLVHKILVLRDRNWLSYDVLFFLVYWILHFLSIVAWLAGDPIEKVAGVRKLFFDENVIRLVGIAMLGASAFSSGFVLFCSSRHWSQASSSGPPRQGDSIGSNLALVRQLTKFSMTIALAALVVKILTVENDFFSSQYGGGPQQYLARLSEIIFFTFLQVAAVCGGIIASRGKRDLLLLSIAVYFFGVGLFLLILGDRGAVALIGLLIISTIGIVRRPISLIGLLSLLGLAGIVFSLAGEGRQSDFRTFSSFVQRALVAETSVDRTFGSPQAYSESVLPALLMAMDVFPAKEDYFHGYFLLRGLIGVIPFSSRLLPFFSEEIHLSSSAEYITWLFFGDNLTRSGMGTSVVAESYIEFGPCGVFVVLFTLGYLGAKLYSRTLLQTGGLTSLVFYVIFSANMIVGARAGYTATLTKSVLWAMAAYQVSLFFIGQPRRRPTTELEVERRRS